MVCRRFRLKDSAGRVIGGGFVCSRGERVELCSSVGCGGVAEFGCDYLLGGRRAGEACERALCAACRIETPDGRDLCPAHARIAGIGG